MSSDRPAAPGASEAALCVRNVAPAVFLRRRFEALHSVTLFSATLAPPDCAFTTLAT